MARTKQEPDQQRAHPSIALTLCGVVLGAAVFGFAAAGIWYQYCLAQGEHEAAAAFADLAPPRAVILLAGLGLVVTVGTQLQMLRERPRADEAPGPTKATAYTGLAVRSREASLVGASDEPVRGSLAPAQFVTS